MDIRHESELFNDSESDDEEIQAVREEDLNKIDETIRNVSRNMRKGDWTYLCRHPEVRAIIRVIVTESIKNKPKNIYSFAADLFHCTNHKKVCKKINKQMKWINKQSKSGTWTPSDGVMHFPESSSSSLLGGKKKSECECVEKFSACDEKELKSYMGPENFKPSCEN